MKPGTLYKVVAEDLSFAKKLNNKIIYLNKGQVLLHLETKRSGEEVHFLWFNEILYRTINKLDEWLEEIET